MHNDDLMFMRFALEEAALAASKGEVPVGAVLVNGPQILARGHNMREARQSALLHAELVVIDQACRQLGSWRLDGTTLYVTLEPCAMCAGAIINARVGRVVFGAGDNQFGCCGSLINLFAVPFPHQPALTGGVLADECARLLTTFFASLRASESGISNSFQTY